uniref:Uncharacterized protein n=1 Tax=Paramormyrops kingsleyae TaxID=1676925 RepID=A0A3B3QH78_9TELE
SGRAEKEKTGSQPQRLGGAMTHGRGLPPSAGTVGGLPPRAGTVGGLPPHAGTVGGLPPSAGRDGGLPPHAGTVGGLSPHAGTVGGLPPHAGTVGGLPPHAGTVGGLPPHAGTVGGLPPHAGTVGGLPPRAGRQWGGGCTSRWGRATRPQRCSASWERHALRPAWRTLPPPPYRGTRPGSARWTGIACSTRERPPGQRRRPRPGRPSGSRAVSSCARPSRPVGPRGSPDPGPGQTQYRPPPGCCCSHAA